MSPHTLPEGNVLISFSGGRTSAYMLHEILQANGGLPDRAEVVFANTGREMPETLDFVQEVGDRWNVPIVWVEDAARVKGEPLFDIVSHNSASRNGEPFKRLIERKKACPDQSKRFCTEHLKYLPARRYLIAQGWTQWHNATGFRADEPDRIRDSTDKRVTRWYPLNDAKVIKQQVLDFWKAQPFDLRVTEGYGNCDGCFMKSEAQIAALARDYPDRAKWWEDMEALASGLASSGSARFRDQYTREELRAVVERQGDLLFALGGFCDAEHGDCTG